jgi:NAD(P)-dependent dehydrogenase (short-subunit alcohol dehydrogenase family)
MRRDGVAGSIVNIGSLAAYGNVPILMAYAASKGALVTLTKNVAYTVMRHRIRVNTLNIGWMDTPGEDAIQRNYHGAGDDWLEQAETTQPFGRLLKPEEVARAVAFLASDESGMMTGSIVDFDQSVIGAGPQPIPPAEEE